MRLTPLCTTASPIAPQGRTPASPASPEILHLLHLLNRGVAAGCRSRVYRAFLYLLNLLYLLRFFASAHSALFSFLLNYF